MTTENQKTLFDRWFFLLQVATASVFLGRAWQHLVFDAPYRDLFWNEHLMKGLIEGIFRIPWSDYVTNPAIDGNIQILTRIIGVLYFLSAVATMWYRKIVRIARVLLILGGFSLFFLAFIEYFDRFKNLGQWLEYTLQWSCPFFLIAAFQAQAFSKRLVLAMKVAVAITFSCHGLYAIGFYPLPGTFVEMVINTLPLDESQAVVFLKIAGSMDFLMSFLLFIPNKKVQKYVLLYAVFWGTATTMARFTGYFHWQFALSWLKHWLHECVFRFPHFLIPALLYWILNKKEE